LVLSLERRYSDLNKILFLVPYPLGCAPSQRYRFEQYLKILEESEFEWEISPFINANTWSILYQDGHYFRKILGYIIGIVNRITLLFKVRKYRWIFIHREAIILGPAIYEWILAKILGKKIIFDFDDAIWISRTSSDTRLLNWFKCNKKTSHILGISNRVCVGNSFLAEYAKRFNPQVQIIPTTIDTNFQHRFLKDHRQSNLVIGWTGSQSTIPFLSELLPPLERLEKVFDFEFLVIADKDPHIPLKSYSFKKWKSESEIDDLMCIDIGLMPLPDDQWSLGKCSLKALQYMALGIPAVVSPIGVNKEVVDHQINGLHCNNANEWYLNIEKLLLDPQLRRDMGVNGRAKVINCYSIEANAERFLCLFS